MQDKYVIAVWVKTMGFKWTVYNCFLIFFYVSHCNATRIFCVLIQTKKCQERRKKKLFTTLHSSCADIPLFARLESNSSLEIYERHPGKWFKLVILPTFNDIEIKEVFFVFFPFDLFSSSKKKSKATCQHCLHTVMGLAGMQCKINRAEYSCWSCW